MKSFLTLAIALTTALPAWGNPIESPNNSVQNSPTRVVVKETDHELFGHFTIERESKDSRTVYYVNGLKMDYSEHRSWKFKNWCYLGFSQVSRYLLSLEFNGKIREKIVDEMSLVGSLPKRVNPTFSCEELEEEFSGEDSEIVLNEGGYVSLDPITTLDLEAIYADQNYFTDLSLVWRMPRLDYLNVSHNEPKFGPDCGGMPEHLKDKIKCRY